MILPFDKKRLQERNAIDDEQHRAEAARLGPAEGVERTLDLSDFVRQLARATGADEGRDERADLEEKARLYAAPLRVLAGRA